MSYMFIIEGVKVMPHPTTLTIGVFKEIWDRDKDPDKSMAYKEFAYIEFMSSQRASNPFKDYPSEKTSRIEKDEEGNETEIVRPSVQHIKVCESQRLPIEYEPDELVLEGIQYWIEYQIKATLKYEMYMSAKAAARTVRNFYTDPTVLSARNPKTENPLYKPSDITRALESTDKIVRQLATLEKQLEEDLFQTKRNTAGKTISPFAYKKSFKK